MIKLRHRRTATNVVKRWRLRWPTLEPRMQIAKSLAVGKDLRNRKVTK